MVTGSLRMVAPGAMVTEVLPANVTRWPVPAMMSGPTPDTPTSTWPNVTGRVPN